MLSVTRRLAHAKTWVEDFGAARFARSLPERRLQRAPCAATRGRALLRRLARLMLGACVATATSNAVAQVAEPSPRDDEAFDFMNFLAERGQHDFKRERWNAYGQVTHISSWKAPFSARYTNLNGSSNSLSTESEHSFTATATLYAGVALWHGAELYCVPEVISLRALSELKGLGGAVQNFELQKSGSMAPTPYNSRLYLRQTIALGGSPVEKTSDPLQLSHVTSSRRLVFTVGKFSVLDLFDKNAYSGDLRRQFFNMAFLAHSAFDFAADARGYAWGGAIEYIHDDWAIRFARVTPPKHPNQLEIDYRLHRYFGDQMELELNHHWFGRPGAIRLLGYRNREVMGRFEDALTEYARDNRHNAASCASFNYGSSNAVAPDLCWARRPNVKVGVGISLEQSVTRDLGLFFRGMYADGKTEVYSYVSSDRSLSFGAVTRGTPWRRAGDLLGVGCAVSWLSRSHADYLRAGGIDGFIGDGYLTLGTERVLELFYSLNLYGPTWLSADLQHIHNPAYNIDRGPVTILGGRFHAEF